MNEIRSLNRRKKEYLMQYQHLVAQQKRLEGRIKQIRLECIFPESTRFDGMPAVRNTAHDLSDAMIRHEEKKNEVLSQLIEIMTEKLEVISDIEMKVEAIEDPIERNILELRYLEGMPDLIQVADALGYSHGRVKHKHGDALRHFKLDTP